MFNIWVLGESANGDVAREWLVVTKVLVTTEIPTCICRLASRRVVAKTGGMTKAGARLTDVSAATRVSV